jgi:superfamily II DNA or RNA helicase
MPAVIAAADTRLRGLREHVPDAGGMIIASDQTTARAYAKLLLKITGESPTVVLSDDKGSSDRIAEFADGTSRWMVAVRMVSAAGRRRLRDQRVDAAVLRPGHRPIRPLTPAR